jgi:fibronectin type 3 domain-containing protein
MSFLNPRPLLTSLVLFSLATSCLLAPATLAQSNVQGQWQTLVTLSPINPVHMALMHNGKVLIVSGSGNDPTVTYFQGGVWDPATDTATTQPVGWDMFCNGMVVLPDGRPFVLGGTINYNPFQGSSRTSAYDPATGNFVDLQHMAHGRWYPTGTVLSDGRVMVFSGLTETGGTNNAVEIYTVGSGWGAQSFAPFTPPLYPRLHVLPNGKVFYSGSTSQSWTFDPTALSWTPGPSTNYGNTRTYGTSVLLPLMPANNYAPKIIIMGGGTNATATTELIDLSASSPKWVYGPSMVQPRVEMNATMLPNGTILTSGGSSVDEDGTTASLKAEIYDPVANSFSSAGSNVYARLYHSNSILLPDATVLLTGSNPVRGTYEQHMELYSPPYLFNSNGSLATRPAITGVTPGVIGYGNAFQVQTPDAANITSAVLIRAGAVTHAFDMDQRLIGLNFTAGSGVLNVTAPRNGNIAPPGYYLLFILNSSGVPSVAQFVQLSATPTDQAPTATITSPASNASIGVGQSVSFSGSGTSPTGTISAYSWVFPGGSPATSTSANPGSVIYSTAGTYVASLTVTDNQGLTSPSPATLTVTVNSGFSLSASPSSQNVASGNSTTYTLTVTPTLGFTGSVSFSASGLPSGASASFSPATVTTSGSTIMTVATSASTPTGNYTLTVTGTSGSVSSSTTASLAVIATVDTQPPTAPTNLSASAASSSQINLSWTASTDNVGVTGYDVERCQGAGCANFAQIAVLGAVTTFNDTGLTPSTSYSYRIRATDAAGNLSPYSNVASASTLAPPPPPIQLVQQVATTVGAGATSLSQIFTGPSVTGDLIVVGVKWANQAVSVASITDDRGNTYASAVGPTNWSGTAKRAQIFYAKNIIGGGAPLTITVTLTGPSAGSLYIYQLEYSHADTIAPLDATAAAIGTATSVSSGSAVIHFPNELIFGFSIADSVAVNPGAGFTAESTFRGNLVEDQMVNALGSYAATGVATGVSNWFMQMATFKTGSADTIPPTAPSNLTALAVGPVQVNLSWTASTDNVGVTGYAVQRCAGAGCINFAQVASLPGTATTYSDMSVSPSTTYDYQIVANDAAGNLSQPSNATSVTTPADTQAPTAPTNLTATVASTTQINLSWTASTDNVGVTGYQIQRCQGTGCTTFAQVGTAPGTANAYSDSSLTASSSYTYQVVATDAAGNLSLPSNSSTAATTGPPAAPSALTATPASATQINLSWTNNAINQTGFKIERSPDGTTFTQIGTAGASSSTYSDPNLSPLTNYYYRVRATNANGDSAYSNVANAATLADTTPPTAPTNLTANAASASQINLSWTASADNVGVTGYKILRCQGAGCTTFAQIAAPTGTGTTFGDTGLSPSTSYSYQVIANDAAGNASAPSNTATAATLAGPPAPPSGLTATATSATQINLSWTNNASTQTAFKVERSPDNVTFTQIATTAATVTVYSNSPLSPLTTYYYRVRATNGAGDSAYSNVASAATPADTTPPTAPMNLAATPYSSSQINLSWTASTDNVGVAGYQIQRCQGSGCTTFAQVGTSTSVSFSDSGLLASTSYSYQVRAMDAANNASAFSNVATAVTPLAALPPVTLVQQAETSVLSGTNTISQTFSAASTTGDLIIVSLKWGNQAVSVSSITDNNGNSFTSAIGPTNWDSTLKRAQTFYAKNITAGPSPITITVTLSGNSTSSIHLYQFEYTNVDPTSPVDATAVSIGLGTAMSCGPVTTNFANDILYAVAFNDSTITNAGAGFTTLTTYHSNVVEQMQTTAAGSYGATATNNASSYWYMHLLAIKRHP